MPDTPSTPPELWQELHEILSEPPSPLTFRALIALLDTWPAADSGPALEYAASALASWPDEHRVMPWSSAQALAQGHSKPTWALAHAIERHSEHIGKESVSPRDLVGRPELSALTRFELDWFDGGLPAVRDIARAGTLSNLSVFRGADSRGDDETVPLQSLADLPLLPHLRELHVESIREDLWHFGPTSFVPDVSPDKPPVWETVTLTASDMMDLWDKTSLPHLTRTSLFITTPAEAERLAGRLELAQLTDLTLAFRCGRNGRSSRGPGNIIPEDDEAARAFFSRASLPGLNRLSIIGYRMAYWGREGMGPDGLDAVIRSGLLRQLRHLHLEKLPLGDRGLVPLAEALPDNQLTHLKLVDVYCRAKGAAALARSSALRALEVLDLSANRIPAPEMILLAETPMPRLRILDLSGEEAGSPYYHGLGEQPVGDDGAAAWAASPNAETLQELRLSSSRIEDAGLQAIAASNRWKSLTKLDLSHNVFGPEGIAALVRSPLWQSLREMNLSNTYLEDSAIRELTRGDNARRLRSLHLAYNSIAEDGAKALANWPTLARLWDLNLHDNVIPEAGLIALAQSPYAGRLLELDIEQDCWNSRKIVYGEEAAQALTQALSKSGTLARLDTLFTGMVDEYHWAMYSTGFSRPAWKLLLESPHLRPEVRASITTLSLSGDEEEEDKEKATEAKANKEGVTYVTITFSDEEREKFRHDHDFRNHPRRNPNEDGEDDNEEESPPSALRRI